MQQIVERDTNFVRFVFSREPKALKGPPLRKIRKGNGNGDDRKGGAIRSQSQLDTHHRTSPVPALHGGGSITPEPAVDVQRSYAVYAKDLNREEPSSASFKVNSKPQPRDGWQDRSQPSRSEMEKDKASKPPMLLKRQHSAPMFGKRRLPRTTASNVRTPSRLRFCSFFLFFLLFFLLLCLSLSLR